MPSLVQLNGNEPGKTVNMTDEGTQYSFGRGVDCFLRLDDDQASRVHAVIFCEASEWKLEDCESLNGTFVNSQLVQRTVLTGGDLIRIGGCMLLFVADETAPFSALSPKLLGDSTRVRRILGAEKRRVADDPIGADSTSGPMRKLAFLYRLSREIYRADDLDTIIRYALNSVGQVIGARETRIVLRTAAGRLQHYSTTGGDDSIDSANVLANWVMEQDEALLIDINENISWRRRDDSVEKGTALGVPVPGRESPRGAIECFHPEGQIPFDVADLEFLISVAQHLGLAVESLHQSDRIKRSNDELRIQLGRSQATLVGDCPAIRSLRPRAG